jgi:putative flippase GtrA
MMLPAPLSDAGRPAPWGQGGASLDGAMAWRLPSSLPARSPARSDASGDWILLAKYCLVGASGYAVNLAVYLALVRGAGLHYLTAAVCSFLVAVTSNYTWNRRWTFRAQRGRVGLQGMRFLFVSTAALAANLVCLRLLVGLGLDEVRVQALAIVLVTPISFLGNKLWSFGAPAERLIGRRRLGFVAMTACLLAAIYLCFAFAGSTPRHRPHAGRTADQPGYSSLRQARGSADSGFGVRASRKEWYGATNGSGAITV